MRKIKIYAAALVFGTAALYYGCSKEQEQAKSNIIDSCGTLKDGKTKLYYDLERGCFYKDMWENKIYIQPDSCKCKP
jgi:hypothetical protein